MPTTWLPWPGKVNARLVMMNPSFRRSMTTRNGMSSCAAFAGSVRQSQGGRPGENQERPGGRPHLALVLLHAEHLLGGGLGHISGLLDLLVGQALRLAGV